MYLTCCNTVAGYWVLGSEAGAGAGIRSKPTEDKFPPSQWQYYNRGSWHKDDATLTIEGQ